MLIRPRIFNTSTTFANDNSGENSVTINLENPIIPEDGFVLVGGIRQIGFDFTATNISHKQLNNRMKLKIVRNKLQFYIDFKNPPVGFKGTIRKQNLNPPTIEEEFDIVLDDGLYQSYKELFDEITSKIIIDTGLRERIWVNPDINQINIIYLTLLFKETRSGFEIYPNTNSRSVYNDISNLDIENEGGVPVYSPTLHTVLDIGTRLDTISLIPNERYPKLWNLLFTNNVRSQYSPGVPDNDYSKTGKNPPEEIKFNIEMSQLIIQYDNVDPTQFVGEAQDQIFSPYSEFIYKTYEKDVVDYYSNPIVYQDSYQKYHNESWKSYSFPYINPLYIDVLSSKLNAIGFSDDGTFQILHRFSNEGATSGVTSLFVEFDSPISYLITKDNISDINIKLETPDNMWSFYNVRLTLSFLFHEIPDEVEVRTKPAKLVSIPPNDVLTAEVASLVPSRFNPTPFYPHNPVSGKSHFFTNKRKR